VQGSILPATASRPPTPSSPIMPMGSGAQLQTSCFASCSMVSKAALSTPAPLPTSAPSVARNQWVIMPSLMQPRLDLLPIVTPLLWDKWEELLGAAGFSILSVMCLWVCAMVSILVSPLLFPLLSRSYSRVIGSEGLWPQLIHCAPFPSTAPYFKGTGITCLEVWIYSILISKGCLDIG
jgi:hypothetical protein